MSNTFDVSIEHGDLIDVKTSVSCGGVYSKTIDFPEAVVIYPNPSRNRFEIAIPTLKRNVLIEVYNYASQLILSGYYKIQYGKVTIDFSDKPIGLCDKNIFRKTR